MGQIFQLKEHQVGSKSQLHRVYKRHVKYTERLKVKGQKKKCHSVSR